MKGVHGLKGDKTRKLPKKFLSNVGPAQPASGKHHTRRLQRNRAKVAYYMGDIKAQTTALSETIDAANRAAMTRAVKQGLNPMHAPLIDKALAVRGMVKRVARFYGAHGKYASAKVQLWLAGVKPTA